MKKKILNSNKNRYNCEFYQKNMIPFINDKMDAQETINMINHIKKCPDCMEEFSINYLVIEGVNCLDTAGSFNLQNELQNKLEHNEEHAKTKKTISFFMFVFFIILAIVCGYYISSLFYV